MTLVEEMGGTYAEGIVRTVCEAGGSKAGGTLKAEEVGGSCMMDETTLANIMRRLLDEG